jgi:hypothetical protein
VLRAVHACCAAASFDWFPFRSDNMALPLRTTEPTPTSSPDADAQCRGTGVRATPADGRADDRRSAGSSACRDMPLGSGLAGLALQMAIAEAVALDARERLADAMRLGVARVPATASERASGPSPELARCLERVRTTVSRYARERRAAGLAIVRLIPEVKALVRQEGCQGWFDRADVLMAQAVSWTIAAYYDPPERAHPMRGD